MSTLSLPLTIYEQIRAHGERTYPDECCGALLGRSTPAGWQVEAVVETGNSRTDSPHNRFRIPPLDLVKIAQEAHRLELEIAGFYHSHPDHPADWSRIDLAEAHWIGCSFVITSVLQGKAAQTSSFLLTGSSEEDKRFESETIQIGGEPANSPATQPENI
jgi:proteasome lid subunit RPN8/RPN11